MCFILFLGLKAFSFFLYLFSIFSFTDFPHSPYGFSSMYGNSELFLGNHSNIRPDEPIGSRVVGVPAMGIAGPVRSCDNASEVTDDKVTQSSGLMGHPWQTLSQPNWLFRRTLT